jgi:UDP-3-O-[3-hydroxymyristoyl] glucosamine N-acyltransferase
MKLKEIGSRIGARLNLPADATANAAEAEITGVAAIEKAGPHELTFVTNQKYAAAAKTTNAAAVIVADDFPAISRPTLRAKNPHYAYARALELFHEPPKYAPGIHPTAVIAKTARIGARAHIAAYVVINDDVEIGDDAVLLPHVVIYRGARIGSNFFAHAHSVVRENCRIGNNVLLQNGVVIGCDGFGFAKTDQGWYKVLQPGIAVIGDSVEVQANSCIDRASLGETQVGRGTKIDNLAHIGHNCEVEDNVLICAQVGMAGSTVVRKNAILTGQVGVVGHCTIGEGAIVTPQTGVANDVEAGKIVSGSPAVDHRDWLRYSAVLPKLPEIARAMRRAKNQTSE